MEHNIDPVPHDEFMQFFDINPFTTNREKLKQNLDPGPNQEITQDQRQPYTDNIEIVQKKQDISKSSEIE